MKIPFFEIGMGLAACTVIANLSVIIYLGTRPPIWMAYPLPPAMALVLTGMIADAWEHRT